MRDRRRNPYDDRWDKYDESGYDERQESISASEHGRAGRNEIGGHWTPGAWGRGNE